MTDRTSTTWVREEAKKRAGAVKGIDETDPRHGLQIGDMVVFSLCRKYSLFLPFFANFWPYFHNPPHPYSAAIGQ
jgi:hypothetical protein